MEEIKLFCVIQEIETKKSNKYGYPKEIISNYYQWTIGGEDMSHYSYHYSEERFERPIKKAYRISIHHSYRENGKVKKKQYVLCTVNYYDLATDSFNFYDWADSKICKVAEELNESIDDIYELVEDKIKPLREQIQAEFSKTEEFITHQEHEKVTTIYAARKVQFGEKYGVNSSEYDKCYDVFGEFKNPEYLEKIKREFQQRKESRSYYEKYYNNYTGNSSNNRSSYHDLFSNNYADNDKEILKQFYRVLSKKFYPDANPNQDTSEQMKLLNQLKSDWGL